MKNIRTDQDILTAVLNSFPDSIEVFNVMRNDDGMIIDFKWQWMNDAARVQHGDQVGKRLKEVNVPVLGMAPFSDFTSVIETGITRQYERPHQQDGHQVWTLQILTRLNDGIVVTTRDITNTKKSSPLKQGTLLSEKYRSVINSLDDGFCIIKVLFDGENNPIDYRFIETNPAFLQQTGIENPIGKTMRELRPMHEAFWFNIYGRVALTGEHMRFEHEAVALGKYYDVFAFPFGEHSEKQVGIFFKDIRERKIAEQDLKKSEERFRTVANIVPDLLWHCEPDGLTNWYNDRWMEYTGHDPLHIAGLGWTDVLHPDDQARAIKRYAKALESAKPLTQEYRIRRADAEYRWFSVRIMPMTNTSGQVVKMYGAATDIHYQRMAFDTLRKSDTRYAYLLKLSEALRSLENAPDIQETACRILGEQLGASRVAYFTVRGKYYFIERNYTNGVSSFNGRYPIASFGAEILTAYRNGKRILATDVAGDHNRSKEELAAYAAVQIGAYIGIPLIKKGEFVVGLGVHQQTPRKWTDEEIVLVEETAERTWAAVERANVENALRQSEENLALALDAGRMGNFEWNSETGKLQLSEISRELFGLIPGEDFPAGNQRFQMLHEDDREKHEVFFEQAIHNNRDYHNIYRIIRPADNKTRWVEERAKVYTDIGTHATRIIGVHWDVTDQVVAENQVKKLLKQREEFIANASHELKTPLTSIKVYAEMVNKNLQQKGDSENSFLVSRINTQVNRLSNLIRDLLDITRIEEGKMLYNKEVFELNDLVRERLEEMQLLAGERKISLLLNNSSKVLADRERITQVFNNIVTNALKYSPQESEIKINSRSDGQVIEVSVADEGIGIPQESLAEIFNRFYRVGSRMMNNYPGMGLGLYISAEIIKNHGGNISVTSIEGEGSVFKFTLPLIK